MPVETFGRAVLVLVRQRCVAFVHNCAPPQPGLSLRANEQRVQPVNDTETSCIQFAAFLLALLPNHS